MGRVRGRGRVAKVVRSVIAVVAVVLLASAPASAELQQAGARADEGGFWSDVGLGAGAAATNLIYIPTKLVYAVCGTVVGGLAWLVTLGSTETANAIWEPTLGGTYVLTPAMLAGEEKLHFNGPPAGVSDEEPTFQESETRW